VPPGVCILIGIGRQELVVSVPAAPVAMVVSSTYTASLCFGKYLEADGKAIGGTVA
jgi:hypothetical protein